MTQTNPDARIEFQPDEGGPTWELRPLTLEEEHRVFDIQEREGVWSSRAYVLRRCLVGARDHRRKFEANAMTGGASDEFLRSISLKDRARICDRLIEEILISEEQLEK